ncbi:splicing factor U2af large subunit A-like [Bidens hawaiensis]|uniref:splicing factor U2af large subunit A-like n=1 Tax=Bidens hawaiensis TaxID=980011 RepID=UPI00404989BE
MLLPGALEGPDLIYVGGLPCYFTEAQVRELLESFGAVRDFSLVKDGETGNSNGYGLCVYQDSFVTDIACAALNGLKMGDKTLIVRRANQGQIHPNPQQQFTFPQFGAFPLMPVQARVHQQATRHARRVYVGGLPPSANEQNLATFFSHAMAAIGGNAAGPG